MITHKTTKRKYATALPHRNVYTRLAPSKISGVGVFAICNIKKGANIFPDIDDEIIWINEAKIKSFRGEIRRLYDDYCVRKNRQYGAPISFNCINVSWYLNHSAKPNTIVDERYRVIACQNIRKGEELTLDYTTFMDIKIPMRWK
jgi:SET domain-containing protein